jgi:hypothetical protein
MSLDKLANKIASKGRNGDSMLVHFNPQELEGLHSLARSMGAKSGLTINPETGLYEAFKLKKFFKSVLPTILGVAANFIVPGSGILIGALAGAALNKDNRLMGAVLGGVGAYGGTQLAASLSSAGANAGAAAAGSAAETAAIAGGETSMAGAQLAGQTAAAEAAGAAGAAGSAAPALSWSNTLAGLETLNPVTQGLSGALANAGNLIGAPATAAAGATPAVGATGLGGWGAAGSALMKAGAPLMLMAPEEEESSTGIDFSNTPGAKDVKARRYAFSRNAAGMIEPGAATGERRYFDNVFTMQPEEPVTAASGGSLAALQYLQRKGPSSGDAQAASEYMQGRGKIAQHKANAAMPDAAAVAAVKAKMMAAAAAGGAAAAPAPAPAPAPAAQDPYSPYHPNGSMNYNNGGYYDPNRDTTYDGGGQGAAGGRVHDGDIGHEAVALQSGGFVFPADVVAALGAGSSGAGLEVLAKKFGAKPISGKGHGQSDDIPAMIDGQRKARVARDEAVLDAAQVARVGGGDPKKGAKKLYDMMTRVRKQATGSPKQMRAINVNSALR